MAQVIDFVIFKTLVLREKYQTEYLSNQMNIYSHGPVVRELLKCRPVINVQLQTSMQIMYIGCKWQVVWWGREGGYRDGLCEKVQRLPHAGLIRFQLAPKQTHTRIWASSSPISQAGKGRKYWGEGEERKKKVRNYRKGQQGQRERRFSIAEQTHLQMDSDL